MNTPSIDQFLPSVAAGDGVTNSSLFIRSLLVELGYRSNISSHAVPPELSGQIRHASAYRPCPEDLLIYHHSMGHDHGPWLLKQPVRKYLAYHNITPAEFFLSNPVLRQYATLGRQQLADWKDSFPRAIALSPLNHKELADAGYEDIRTLPLLIDSRRLDGAQQRPRFIDEATGANGYYLSVGRVVENKQQHLLVEAFFHTLQMQDRGHNLLLVGGISSEDYARALMLHIRKLGLETRIHLTGKCADSELRWLYKHACQYWCASAHEGFCMPLVEANHADLPVLSLAHSNVPATLGESGLLLESDDPIDFAHAALLIENDPQLRKKLVLAGQQNLRRFDRDLLKQQLRQWLADDCG